MWPRYVWVVVLLLAASLLTPWGFQTEPAHFGLLWGLATPWGWLVIAFIGMAVVVRRDSPRMSWALAGLVSLLLGQLVLEPRLLDGDANGTDLRWGLVVSFALALVWMVLLGLHVTRLSKLRAGRSKT